MNKEAFLKALSTAPVIAAVKNDEALENAVSSPCRAVFVLYGSILTLPEIVKKIYASGRAAIVHLDLIDGLAARESAVDYISSQTLAHGVISTKGVLIRRARQLGLIAIQRFFLLDSLALSNIPKQVSMNAPDFIEVIPGGMPKIIGEVCAEASVPVITGGLIRDVSDAANALNAGAVALSVSSSAIWALNSAVR